MEPLAQFFYLILFLVLPTIAFKFLLVKFNLKLTKLEGFFFSFFLGQIVWVLVLFLISVFLGLSKSTIFISLTPFIISDIYILWKNSTFLKPDFEFTQNEKIFLTVLIVTGLGFFFLLSRHMMPENSSGYSTPHNTFGDIEYHVAIVNSFYLGGNFPPQNPIYAGVRLSYPFLIDFYSAVYRSNGFSLHASLIIPGLIFGICVFAFFLMFAYRFLGNTSAALASLLVFAFNGGLGGYLVLWESLRNKNFWEALAGNFSSVIDKYNFRFPNGVSSVFMAERPILVGISAFFAILILLWIGFEKRKADRELILAGLIIGLMPLWHTHTLVALGLILPLYFVAYWFYNKTSFARTFRFIIPILYLSIPLAALGMLWHLPQVVGGGVHFFSFKTGWVVGSEGFWTFWFRNLGIFLLLLPFAFVLLDRKQKLFYIPILFIFIFANLVNFQPFDWDNYKILFVWYMVSSVVATRLLYVLSKSGKVGKIFSTSIVLFLTISGVILITGDYLTYYGLFSREDIELSNWEVVHTSPRDIILTGPQHNQFSILAGRKILMGYPGYLWTQGIDSGSRENDIRKMYHGDAGLIVKYGVKYIVLGYTERQSYHPDEDFLGKTYPLIKETQNFKIYKVI